jgi:ABC-type Fe3+ transport system substrate-binding protein
VPGSAAGVADGKYLATPAVAGDPRPSDTVVLPKSDRFISWARRGAIFKQAKHPAAAKLFLSWLSSAGAQGR